MIDPMVSLAFAVYSNKGAYALLLGPKPKGSGRVLLVYPR
jgi:hypothetical protein